MRPKFTRFPTVVVDGFLSSPNAVREYGLSLDYFPTPGYYPGQRSKNLIEVNKKFADELLKKVFSLYWEDTSNISCSYCSFFFQKIPPYSEVETDFRNFGWIHRDSVWERNRLAGVLYLTPGARLESGTSVYRMKEGLEGSPVDHVAQQKVRDSKDFLFTEKSEFLTEDDLERIKTIQNDWNGCFETITQVNNVYNRVISFDGNEWHAANNYYTGDQERLTIVYFIDNVKGATMPKDRVVKDNLTEIINAPTETTI